MGQMKWLPANDKLQGETGRGNEETSTAGGGTQLSAWQWETPTLAARSSRGNSTGNDGGVWCGAEAQPQSRASW